ncbi:unnamed protein product [Linum tenue]|uniref:Uncharacterized protein n=1 Tax=Linum tenue TaxID=586396 RepID=A0AAV0RKG3_9ROSI|nr:unnamed protein product [Linum tenue]
MVGSKAAIEVAKTVIEVADVAWTAMEFNHHHLHTHDQEETGTQAKAAESMSVDEELIALRSENRRLKSLLEHNLKLLQNLSESPPLMSDCPPDLYARLAATVDSEKFLSQLKSLQEATRNGAAPGFPFKEATVEVLIKVDQEEPSRWVWVTEEMIHGNTEEHSGIDNECYVVINEDQVIDAVATFMAKCITANPKSQVSTCEFSAITQALGGGGVSKFERAMDIWHAWQLFYALSTWGIALAGLYKTRAVWKYAAVGVHKTSKVVLRAL